MKIYLLNKQTNDVVQEFDDVLNVGHNYVEYLNGGCRGRIYCDEETEYFSKNLPEKK